MKTRKIIASIFIIIALILGGIFLSKIVFPQTLTSFFEKQFYSQFGPFALSIELLVAGIFLYRGGSKANFALALFGFTALLDPLFNIVGLFTNLVPIYAMVLFLCCGVVALWLAFSDVFGLGRISFWEAMGSFLLGAMIEWFFNSL